METSQNPDQSAEINKLHQLLAKNIDDFKYLVLCNMRLEQSSRPSDVPLHPDINRISGFDQKTTSKESPSLADDESGEPLEEWVTRQRVKVRKSKPSGTIIDFIERWLMNEAKKDLFAELDAIYGGPEGLSSRYIRELGLNLISLADKLDRMKSKTPGTQD